MVILSKNIQFEMVIFFLVCLKIKKQKQKQKHKENGFPLSLKIAFLPRNEI